MVNEVRLNYTYGRFTRNFPPGFDAKSGRNLSTELGLPSLTPGGLPEFITGGGNIGWSQSQQNENAEHTYNIANTLSWVRGKQTWKFGVDLLQQRLKTIPMFGASGGRYEFNRNMTLTNSALTNGAGGNVFAQFLLGVYNQATLRDSLIPYYYEWNSCAGFVQNDWQVRRDLTLNLGLRYSLQLPRTEKYDRQGAFRPDLAQEFPLAAPVTLPTGQVITTALVPPFAYPAAAAGRATSRPIDWNGWEPRFGFAWVPGAAGTRTAARRARRLRPVARHAHRRRPQSVARLCVGHDDLRLRYARHRSQLRRADLLQQAAVDREAPDEVLNIPRTACCTSTASTSPPRRSPTTPASPAMHSWSATVGYELPWQTVVELSYNGSRGVHLFLPPINANPVPFELSEAYLGLGLDPLSNVADPLGRRDPNGAIIRSRRDTSARSTWDSRGST